MKARELLDIAPAELFKIQDGSEVDVLFDDGKDSVSKKELILSRYCWELFRDYPDVPIYKEHCAKAITRGKFYNAKTIKTLLEVILNHIVEVKNIRTYEEKHPLVEKIFQINNHIYNELMNLISDQVATIDAVDFIEVVENPKIVKAQKELEEKPDNITVDNVYKEISQILNYESDLNNSFVVMYKSGSVSAGQANQCIGPRGFISDLNRKMFLTPAIGGFIRGMRNLYEVIIESRTAAKSLHANNVGVVKSEYTSRQFQLLTMTVEDIEYGDCGSTEYMEFLLKDEDLPYFEGKYYLDPETAQLKVFRGNEKHLVGQEIKFRTILGCKLKNPRHICEVCFGETAKNYPRGSNIGYTLIADFMKAISQSILSTKHLLHSVKHSVVKLEGEAVNYFKVSAVGDVYFHEKFPLKDTKLLLNPSNYNRLIDALNSSTTNISSNKIGEVNSFTFMLRASSNNPVYKTFDFDYPERIFLLSKTLFEYMRSVGHEVDERGNCVIDLSGYDQSQAIMNSIVKERDMVVFVLKLKSLLGSKDKDQKSVRVHGERFSSKITKYDRLDLLYRHVVGQARANITSLEILTYCLTVMDKSNNDYRLARNSEKTDLLKLADVVRMRDFAQMFVFERQQEVIFHQSFKAFRNPKGNDHPFDVLFTPNEVLSKKKQK